MSGANAWVGERVTKQADFDGKRQTRVLEALWRLSGRDQTAAAAAGAMSQSTFWRLIKGQQPIRDDQYPPMARALTQRKSGPGHIDRGRSRSSRGKFDGESFNHEPHRMPAGEQVVVEAAPVRRAPDPSEVAAKCVALVRLDDERPVIVKRHGPEP